MLILHLVGSFAASPTIMASPVLSTGRESIIPANPSDIADLTMPLSVELFIRSAIIVPHCDKMVSSISEGLWLTIIAPTPNLRPSFAIL